MRPINYFFVVLLCLLISSCGFWGQVYNVFLDEGDYEYQYYQDLKELDVRNGTWSILSKDKEVSSFFSKQLGDRLIRFNNLKNEKGQYVYPYGIEELNDAKLKEIYQLTGLNFLVVQDKEHRSLIKEVYTDESTIYITVYNLKTEEIHYQIVGKVLVDDNGNKIFKPKLRKRVLKRLKKQVVN